MQQELINNIKKYEEPVNIFISSGNHYEDFLVKMLL